MVERERACPRIGVDARLHRRAAGASIMSLIGMALHQHLLDIADIFSERDIRIETGPAKHGTTQAYFLYCFEPGGNRVELFGDTGYLIFDPDWKTVVWNVENEIDLEKSSIWFGGQLAKSFYRYATPVVPGHSLEEIGR